MEIRALLSAMWRSKTGPLLVAAQVAITLAVVVNVAYLVQQRLADANKPTGLDLDNMGSLAHDIKVEMSKLKFVDEPVRSSSTTSTTPTGAGTTTRPAGTTTTTASSGKQWYPDHAILSGASTGTYNIDADVAGLTELQAGSYVFMDVDYRRIGGQRGAVCLGGWFRFSGGGPNRLP